MTTVDLAAPQSQDEPACLAHPDGTRRRALLGAAAVAVGAVCAGCASSKSTSASASTGTTTAAAGSGSGTSSTSAAAPSSPASGSAASSGSSGAAAALSTTSAVPVGGGTVLQAQKIVLTQPTAGTFKAFSAVCTHQGCLVGTVENGLIVCPCHGSAYHIADGSVANGPASQGLSPVAIKVDGNQITAA